MESTRYPRRLAFTGIHASRLRRWLRGYEFTSSDGERHSSPRVWEAELPVINDTLAMSFLDLQEARCFDEFRKRGIGWTALREMHAKAARQLGTRHPFSTNQFKTAGRRIMREFIEETGDEDRILVDLASDQLAFREVLAPYLKGLQFLHNRPVLWFPLGGSKRVVIDPKRAFGHPIVAKRGVPTAILCKAHAAEGSLEKVARWYEVDLPSVKDAVKYERALAA